MKNPFLSAWLSAANSMAGKVRSRAISESKRQVSAAIHKGQKAVTPSAAKPAPAKKRTGWPF